MYKKVTIIKTTIISLLWISLIGPLPSIAQTSNVFSDECCVINNRIKDCFSVIKWDNTYSDTVFINTTDSIIAIQNLPGRDMFYLNYINRLGFIVFELICKNDESIIKKLPIMKRKINVNQWETIFPNMKRTNNEYVGSGKSEKKLLAETWFKLQLHYKKKEKSLVIVLLDPPNTASNETQAKRSYLKFD